VVVHLIVIKNHVAKVNAGFFIQRVEVAVFIFLKQAITKN